MELDIYDLNSAIKRLPNNLVSLMKSEEWVGSIFIGGGYLRSVVAMEPINDIDVFVKSSKDAELLAYKLCSKKEDVIVTENAYTVKGKLDIQIIHRWVFENIEDVGNSFDFTVCNAVFSYNNGKWVSFCDDRFYVDISAKRIIYRNPVRNEDAGGSMLRVLKYYQKGYRVPLDSLGAIIARLIKDINVEICPLSDEEKTSKVITGLLREVDPNTDPLHYGHVETNDANL
jgi:hypothetical protein